MKIKKYLSGKIVFISVKIWKFNGYIFTWILNIPCLWMIDIQIRHYNDQWSYITTVVLLRTPGKVSKAGTGVKSGYSTVSMVTASSDRVTSKPQLGNDMLQLPIITLFTRVDLELIRTCAKIMSKNMNIFGLLSCTVYFRSL